WQYLYDQSCPWRSTPGMTIKNTKSLHGADDGIPPIVDERNASAVKEILLLRLKHGYAFPVTLDIIASEKISNSGYCVHECTGRNKGILMHPVFGTSTFLP